MRRIARATLPAAALLLAGCLAAPSTLPPPAAPSGLEPSVMGALAAALVDDHDHSDPALHAGLLAGAHEADRVALPSADAPSAVGEVDIQGDRAYVATFSPTPGFSVLDLTDPGHPKPLGHYEAGVPYAADIKATADNHWAFLATEPEAILAALFAPGFVLDGAQRQLAALTGGDMPLADDLGVQIVDVSDPTHPARAGFFAAPDPTGYHMLSLAEIGGSLYVFGACLGTGKVDILRFEAGPVPHLLPVGFYRAPDATSLFGAVVGQRAVAVHDMTVEPDPLEGFPLMTVSYLEGGVHFVDVRDPANPKFLGKWDGFTEVSPGNAHTSKVTAVEGHRIALATPEYSAKDHQGVLWVVDATDFAAPELLGTWSIPGDHPITEPYDYSTHNVEVRGGKAYLAHYHAGAYVLDVSTLAKAAEPELLAVVLPQGVEDPAPFLGGVVTASPMVWDAVPAGPWLYLGDMTAGLRVVALEPSAASEWSPAQSLR